jgi:hypothetical protein
METTLERIETAREKLAALRSEYFKVQHEYRQHAIHKSGLITQCRAQSQESPVNRQPLMELQRRINTAKAAQNEAYHRLCVIRRKLEKTAAKACLATPA